MITEDGCWADIRIDAARGRGRPALFLDRDGVLIEDTGYPHRPEDVVLIPEALSLVRAATDRGFVAGIVSNQSGVGRGMFDWTGFCAVQRVIDQAVAAVGGRLDFVLACPHHGDATVARYRQADHPWRKPAPGMILAAAAALALDVGRSFFVGDRLSDMEAAAAAQVPGRLLLDAGQAPGCVGVTRQTLTGMFESLAGAIP